MAAVLAAAPLLPHATAYADTGGVHISSYEIEGGYAPVNEGVGYRTSGGQVSYCYDHGAHGPGRAGQDYTDIREATHEEDYLLAKGYPMTSEIGGTKWSDTEAQAVTQMAVWLASGTASEGDFADADPAMVAAAESLAGEAETYQGGDAAIDGRGSVCFVAGKPAVQSMLVAKPGWNILLEKGFADAKVTAGNAQYSLAGAVYGVYKGEALVARITTDADGHGTTDTRLPDGAYTVREMEAPAGYALSDEAKTVVIDGADAFVGAEDAPVTVRLVLVKKDSETGEAAPQGAATLDGAEYEATYAYDGGTKTVKGTTEGARIVFEGIPLGTVTVRETKAPEGYLPDTEEHVLAVTAEDAGNEAVFELAPDGEFTEQVKRGDVELVKVGEGDYSRLANVPFKITSKTTGESHVIVTDANGYASTAASWNAHTADTNGGTSGSGIWFGTSASDDSKGALLYDTYTVEEQRCDSNAGRALIPAFDVTVYRDSVKIDLGTIEDPVGPAVRTEATDADDGDHEAVADDSVTIMDTVSCTGLTPGEEYTLTGTLVDKETGEPVQSDGRDVTSTVAFTPEAPSGSANVTFEFDGSALGGHAVVVFESLKQDEEEVASHADIDDEGQTVELVPPETPPATPPSEEHGGGKLPQTGDTTSLLPAGLAAAATACVAAAVAIRRGKDVGADGEVDDEAVVEA
ncbi:VaFE repeat-containing surface-anchored protein [Olsenella phocaeensis]|uniref:VaFE repeat-containing surface-anchored protein n=1 Tax=Olsenella phocaeensis TaxID=1852385 RepID=UPI003A95064A